MLFHLEILRKRDFQTESPASQLQIYYIFHPKTNCVKSWSVLDNYHIGEDTLYLDNGGNRLIIDFKTMSFCFRLPVERER